MYVPDKGVKNVQKMQNMRDARAELLSSGKSFPRKMLQFLSINFPDGKLYEIRRLLVTIRDKWLSVVQNNTKHFFMEEEEEIYIAGRKVALLFHCYCSFTLRWLLTQSTKNRSMCRSSIRHVVTFILHIATEIRHVEASGSANLELAQHGR